MADAEIMVEHVRGVPQKTVAWMPARHHQMRGQRDFGGAGRPDVEMVNPRHAGPRGERRFDFVRVDPVGDGMERHRHRLREQPPGSDQDHRDDDQADDRIDPC